MNSFIGQNENEEVLMVFRRHPIAMRKGFYTLLIPFLFASLPILIWPDNFNFLWVALGGFGIGLIGFFYHWIGWYFSIFIVSDQRLRQVSQRGLFSRSVIDLGLNKIQNMSVDVPGFSATIFEFGTIVIQTYVGDLVLDRLHRPEKIYNSLMDIVNKHGSDAEQKKDNEESIE
jgi:uncharacterized membrane protein YdbT with pleckstrin-like domain